MWVSEHAVSISMSREMMIDYGLMGPLGRNDAEALRWRNAWHRYAESRAGWLWGFRVPPPWESCDRPALPVVKLWGWRWLDVADRAVERLITKCVARG